MSAEEFTKWLMNYDNLLKQYEVVLNWTQYKIEFYKKELMLFFRPIDERDLKPFNQQDRERLIYLKLNNINTLQQHQLKVRDYDTAEALNEAIFKTMAKIVGDWTTLKNMEFVSDWAGGKWRR